MTIKSMYRTPKIFDSDEEDRKGLLSKGREVSI
jgi:hypothetical protein